MRNATISAALATATLALTGSAPASASCADNDQACYAHCVTVAHDIKHNQARITNAQEALDTTASRRKRRVLHHTLRVLRHQRSHLLRVQQHDCA